MLENTSVQLEVTSESLTSKQVRDTTPLRFITCGSVDDGKSTLIGRLLWDTKMVPDDQAQNAISSNIGASDGLNLPDFANLLDGLQAEQEQGITIDVAYRYFSTSRRSFIVADTPGHEQYTRNMATGASTADVAVLLVDARAGILEQTRRHATIASLMGIGQLVLVINKIDLAEYSQDRFEEIVLQFDSFSNDLGFNKITSIPTSAVKGENVALPATESMPWYDGPTLLEILELSAKRSKKSAGFRLPVQRVCRPDESFRGYQGTIAGGSVKPGDSVVIIPSGEYANVSKIVTFDLVRNAGVDGDAVTLVLDRQVDVSRGDMIVSPDARPTIGHGFEAKLIVLTDEGIENNKRYWLKSNSRRQQVVVQAKKTLDLKTQQWNLADDMKVNAVKEVQLNFDEIAVFDSYLDNRETGSFILIDPDTNNTVAGGMITRVIDNVAPIKKSSPDDMTVLVLPTELADKILQLSIAEKDQIISREIDTSTKDGLKMLEEIADAIEES